MKKYLILATIILTTGCVSPYKATVDDYLFAYENVVLGMSVKEVKEILEPSQRRLSTTQIKLSDKYEKED